MDTHLYSRADTALLFVDPYNDFLAEGGKFWPMVKDIAHANGLLDNLRAIQAAVRAAGIKVVIVPHRRWHPGDFEGFDHATPYQLAGAEWRVFEAGGWGGEWHPDFAPRPGDAIAKEHWSGSGFQSTDLDVLLKQHRVIKVIVVGLLANTCIESTSRFASELGYHVTLVKDATAAFSPDRMHAAHELNGPTYAHAILTTAELLTALGQDAAAASPAAAYTEVGR